MVNITIMSTEKRMRLLPSNWRKSAGGDLSLGGVGPILCKGILHETFVVCFHLHDMTLVRQVDLPRRI